MDWIDSFEKIFSIIETDRNSPYLIIEGECRYVQKLNGVGFAVLVGQNQQFFNQQNCNVYDNFDVISFIVNSWIKIQDSLEMIFNLLTGCSVKSLQMLSYLRQHNIPVNEFVLYLYQHHKIILINRFTYPSNNTNRKSQLTAIKKMIQNLNSNCHFLIVGDREHTAISKINNVIAIGKVVHPSGVVLNNFDVDYFRTWYQLDDNACKYKTTNFSLSNFKRL
jgi:hypothetical protein